MIVGIKETLENGGVVSDAMVRERFVEYLKDLFSGTEYDGVISTYTQNTDTVGENSIVVGAISEVDAINAYNGIVRRDADRDSLYFRHDRDLAVAIEINMSDNDALWMASKYVSMKLMQDLPMLSSSRKFKCSRHPAVGSIEVRDSGARKIWTARIMLNVKIHNLATMTAELY